MSASAENEYFSDGISEGLLNLLAKVSGLQVAERALTVLEEATTVLRMRGYLHYITLGDHFADVAHDPRYREALRTMNLEASAR